MPIMDTAYFLNQLTNKHLYNHPHNQKTVLDSSLNQKAGPRDCNYFLREEVEGELTWNVLTEHHGPGVMTRLWLTGDPFHGPFEIYVDDDKQPILRTTIDELFSGNIYPFIKPLVLDYEDSSRGRVCYLPIPFNKYLKIRSADSTTSFYWQANIALFDQNQGVKPFSLNLNADTRQALDNACLAWSNRNGLGSIKSTHTWTTSELAPHQETLIYDNNGDGQIKVLIFNTQDLSYAALQRLQLRIFWDGASTPAVDVPFTHFFNQGTKEKDYHAFFMGKEGNIYTCKIPMPFKSVKITMQNNNIDPLPICHDITVEHVPIDTEQRFYSSYEHRSFKYGTVFKALELEGRGRFFGMNLITKEVGAQSTPPNFTQEGNEYIYIDGEQDPSWRGTGTEDYFNCAYYYKFGEIDTPTHGCMDLHTSKKGYTPGYGDATVIGTNNGLVSAYRFHLLDSIPFKEQLIFILEAGCPKKGALAEVNGVEDLSYQWTCYWYQDTEAKEIEERDLYI